MTAMEDDVDDRFAGIDIDSLLNRSDRRPFSLGRKKALYEAPEFIQRLNGEETVMEGQSICIECKIRGFPAPTLRWFKDDEEILDHPRIHVESTGTGTYALIIDNVNKGDEAAYRCRAENLEGQCSSYFFLSVRGKPKSPKKKGQNSSPNKRTVSFPPMFSTIVEKVEEEEKQGKELEKLPPSPMTEFYYALTLKGRQSWPTFVGDWAFANGGHSQKRRTDDEGSHSAPTTPIPNGDHNDRTFLSPSEARAAARRSLRRSELAARAEAKKQRLDEEAAKREKEQDEKQRKEEEERKKLEKEGEDKKNAEMKINMERQKREHAMRMRRKEREERLEREKKAQEEEKLEKERLEAEARQKANEKRKEEARLKEEKRLEEERQKQEEDKRKKEEQKKQEEVRRKEEERKKQEKEKKEKEEAEKKKRDEEARKSEVARKKKEAEEAERKQREEKEKEQKRLTEAKRKKEEEERARKEEEERKNKEAKQKLEEEQKKRGEARLKAEAEKQKQEEKKRQEDKSKLFTDRSETQLRKSPIEPVQEKPAGQKSVLQKFAKHLDSNLEPHAGTTPKHEPKALHLFQEKIDKAENAHNKIGDAKDIHKEKSPVRFGAGSSESLSSKNQQYRHAQTSDKSTDIPNEPQRSRGEDKTSLKPKPEQKVPNEKEINDSKLRPWQQRDKVVQKQEELKSKDQKSREDAAKERLEELRRKDQQRLEELKAAEQKRIDELKQKDRNPIGDLRRRELNQRETLRQKEQKQIEELRRKEQEQREALRQKEEKQREELRKREEKAKEELRASQPKEKKEPTPEEKQKAEEKLRKDREQLKVREVRQNEKLKVNETKQKEELHLKEVRQKEALKEKEKTQTEELKRREEKQLGELREKQQQQKSALQRTREEEEKKRKEQREREEQEELRRQYRKEQIRKEQLRRQHEEETKKRQQKQQEEAARRHAAKQNAEEDDEFQVKVYKRDYSFADLRKSLEAHVGGEVMDPEEHKYWDEILDKHNYSITDIRKAFDTSSSQSERPSRMRARRNSLEETEMLRMRRSSSISDLRESYTNSLDRPKKKKPSEPPRQKDEEFLKRASSITDIRKQFLDVVKKQTESTKPPGVSGRLEAEIAIHHLKPDSPLARFEGGRRSKSPASSRASFDSGRRSMSPVSSRYSPSPSPSPALETKQESTKPAPRAQSELTKLAASMAAKRASFHEMLQGGNPSTNSDKNMKRMSYHGSDSYGSRDIPTYRRAAGWSDDVEKSREIKNPDKIKPAEPKETTKNNPPSSKEDSRSGSETESSSSRVRPFIYNSARTIARRFSKKD